MMHQYLLIFLKHIFIFFHGQVLPGGVDPGARCLLFFEEIRWTMVHRLPGFLCVFCFFSLNLLGVFQAIDGDKFVCLDSYSPTDCLVYSFGIRFGHPRGVQSWCWAKRHPCIHPSIHASLIQRQRYILQIGKDLDIFRYYVPTNTEKTIHNEKYIFKYDQQTLRSEWEFEDLMDSLNCTVI